MKTTAEELNAVTGGNSWNENWGEDEMPSYFDLCCERCGNVLYRFPARLGKNGEEGPYFCPVCNATTMHSWRYTSFH